MSDEEALVKPEPVIRRTQGERRAATRGALVAAARELFAEHGFAGVSREEIVERAGVTRGAMYHYFASKEELFREVYEEVERDMCDAIGVAAMAGSGPVEELRLGAIAFLRAAATGEVRRIAILDSPAVLDSETRAAIEAKYALGMVQAVLGAIEAEGRLAAGPGDQLAPMVMAVLHVAATQIAEGAAEAATITMVENLLSRITSDPV
jgi:AcrR family transcriptional regulator